MTRPHSFERLRDGGNAAADPLVRAVHTALDDDPPPDRLAAVAERLAGSLDGSAAPRETAPSISRSGWRLAVGTAGLVCVLALQGDQAGLRPGRPARPRSTASVQRTAPSIAVSTPAPEPPSTLQTAIMSTQEATKPRRAPRDTKRRLQPPLGELEMLRAAKSALPASPAVALAHLADHRAAYPHGVLEQERQVLQIEALLAARKLHAAAKAAGDFAAEFPRSAHLRRVQRMISEAEVNRNRVANTAEMPTLTD
jgi:hypothetical protein